MIDRISAKVDIKTLKPDEIYAMYLDERNKRIDAEKKVGDGLKREARLIEELGEANRRREKESELWDECNEHRKALQESNRRLLDRIARLERSAMG